MPVATAIIIGATISLIGTGLAMYGQYEQGKAEKEASDYEANLANNNAMIADDNARIQSLANEQGLTDKRRRNAIIQANTEAKFAKTGVAMSSASVMDTLVEEAGILEQETQQQSYEGRGKVSQLKQRGSDYRSRATLASWKGDQALKSSRMAMVGTGISGIGSAVSAGADAGKLASQLKSTPKT